jgi:hypothetical protein
MTARMQHLRTHARTHTHTYAHTRTHAHTHTHRTQRWQRQSTYRMCCSEIGMASFSAYVLQFIQHGGAELMVSGIASFSVYVLHGRQI